MHAHTHDECSQRTYCTAALLSHMALQQAEAAPGLLAKLGRVLKEKAAGDYDRFFKGTSKTRERLGVSESFCSQPAYLLAVCSVSSSGAGGGRGAELLPLALHQALPVASSCTHCQ